MLEQNAEHSYMSIYNQATQFMSSSSDVHTDDNKSYALAQSSGNADAIQLVLQGQWNLKTL